MKYSKPQIVTIGSALEAIQGLMSKRFEPADNTTSDQISTPAAYEADE